MSTRRAAVVATVFAVCVALVGAVTVTVRRDREWCHGGDRVSTTVRTRIAADDVAGAAAVVALGGPPGRVYGLPARTGMVVVRVTWNGPRQSGGSRYELVALDKRVTPAQPLRVLDGWNADGGTGSNWAGAYQTLAEHYPWLAGTAEVQDASGGWASQAEAVDARATATGTVTAAFLLGDDREFTPDSDLLLALFLVDRQGEVRWAKRVYG
ncbi:MAG TPA: hypothetical protein VF054_02635 [Micromonosporaceae bacterium]